MKNNYVVLSVQFYNDKQNQFTGKYYDYLLDKRLYFKYRDSFIKYPFTFEITSGYNYRGSKVRAMEARNIRSNESMDNFKTIQDFWFATDLNRGICPENDFLTELQDSLFKMGVTGTVLTDLAICNCDTAESALSSKTAVDNSYYGNVSVTGITLGGDSSGINSIYIPKDAAPNNGMYIHDYGNITSSKVSVTDFNDKIDEIKKELKTLKINNDKKEKENINMNKFGLNFKFGKVPTSEIRMSMYGPAFKSTDGWFANKDGEYVNVDGFLFGEENYCYMLPATDANIELGDYIYHNNGWCRIIDLDDSNRLIVEKILSHEVVTVLPTKNIFGYEFYTKLMPLFGNMLTASKEQPFGNMLPLMLMDQKADDKNLFMMMMAMQGNMDMSNPFMMMALMDDKSDKSNIFEIMMLMQMMQPKSHKCEGKCKCHEEEEEN